MKPRLVRALRRERLDRPPVWVMRQAGRYLPEYRELRRRYPFGEAVATPAVATEITLQPIRRFGMDGAVIFADIMTPLQAMDVAVDYAPGPRLRPRTLAEVTSLPELDPDRVSHVAETIGRVRDAVDPDVAVIGFAGAPITLLAYLLEGGGSREFMALRAALRRDPRGVAEALDTLARAMRAYLGVQVAAGADVVQLFDTWAGLLDADQVERWAVPAAGAVLAGVGVPTIYFAPGAGHALTRLRAVGADGIGIDWRVSPEQASEHLAGVALQGNLDPAVLFSDPATIREATRRMIRRFGERPGYVANLGHGIHRHTPPEHLGVFVDAVREGP